MLGSYDSFEAEAVNVFWERIEPMGMEAVSLRPRRGMKALRVRFSALGGSCSKKDSAS